MDDLDLSPRFPTARTWSRAALAGGLFLAGALIVGTVARPGLSAQETADIALLPVGDWGGRVGPVAAADGLAYAGIGARVVVFDADAPVPAVPVGRSDLLPGVVRDIAVAGEVALAACEAAGTFVLDLEDPGRPRPTARIAAAHGASAVAVSGATAWIADGHAVQVVDIADPVAPMVIGGVDLVRDPERSGITAIALDGDLALLTGPNALFVVDAARPSRPRLLGRLGQPGVWQPTDVVAVSGYAWVADGNADLGIHVVDLRFPDRPRQVAGADVQALRFARANGLLYAVARSPGGGAAGQLVALDASVSDRPLPVGTVALEGRPVGLAVDAGRAWVGLADRGLQVLEVGGAGHASPLGLHASAPVSLVGADPDGVVAVTNGIGDADRALVVLDATDPSIFAEIGRLAVPTETAAIDVMGDLAILAAGSEGLVVVDLSVRTEPRIAAQLASGGRAAAVALADGIAFLADRDAGLRVIDVSDPAAPAEVGELALSGAVGLAPMGSLLYVADGQGLRVVDVRDPARPRAIGRAEAKGGYPGPVPVNARDVDAVNDHAYLAMGRWGLSAVDVADPASPREVDGFLVPRDAGTGRGSDRRDVRAVAAAGGRLHALTSPADGIGAGSLLTFRLTDPARPEASGWPWQVGAAAGVAVTDDLVYLADGAAGLLVLAPRQDLTPTPPHTPWPSATPGPTAHPTGPPRAHAVFVPWVHRRTLPASRPVDFVPVGQAGGLAVTVAAAGDTVWAGIGPRLLALDVTDPSRPVPVGRTPPLGMNVLGLALDGNRAYITGGQGRVRKMEHLIYPERGTLAIVDIADRTAPVVMGRLDVETAIRDVAVSGGLAFLRHRGDLPSVSEREAGITIVDVRAPNAPVVTARLALDGHPARVLARGTTMYVLGSRPILRVFDVSEPDRPRLRGTAGEEWPDCYPGTEHAALVGNTVWGTCLGELVAVDVTDPDSPEVVSTWPLEALVDRGEDWACCTSLAVAVSNDALAMLEMDALRPAPPAVLVFDVSDRRAPRLSLDLPLADVSEPYAWAEAIAIDGDTVYATTADAGGLRVVGRADGGGFGEIGAWRDVGSLDTVAVEGDRLYGADAVRGLEVIDVTDATAPRLTGTLTGVLGLHALVAAGRTVYGIGLPEAESAGALVAIDLLDPAGPRVLGSLEGRDRLLDLAAGDGTVYLASGQRGMDVVDVSDPGAMATVATYGSRGYSRAVALQGGLAYVADAWGGLSVVDVSDPSRPREAGFLPTDGWGEVIDVALLGDRAVAIAGFDEWQTDLLALDLARPTEPRLAGRMVLDRWLLHPPAFALTGRYAVLDLAGLRAVDIVEPTGPVVAGTARDGTLWEALAAEGPYVYAAAGQGGLYVFRLEER